MTVMKLKSIEFAEKHFDCFVGPPKAYFEIGGVRGVYVVYAAVSKQEGLLDDWLIENVFVPLQCNGAIQLFWRNPNKIELTEQDGRYRIWTRIVALDWNSEAVVIQPMVKIEGESCKELDYDSDSTEDEVDE